MSSRKAFMGIAKIGAILIIFIALAIVLMSNDLSFFAKSSIYETTKKNCEFSEDTILQDSDPVCNPTNCDQQNCSDKEAGRWESLKTGFEETGCFENEDKCGSDFEEKMYKLVVENKTIDDITEDDTPTLGNPNAMPSQYSLSQEEFTNKISNIDSYESNDLETLVKKATKDLELNFNAVQSLVKKETGQELSQVEVIEEGDLPSLRFECHIYNGKSSNCEDLTQDVEPVKCTLDGGSFSRVEEETGVQAFKDAREKNEDLAICSSSFGAFQILGSNAETLGFSGEDKYVNFLDEISTAKGQAKLFFQFLHSKNLLGEFQKENPNWALISKRYNGAAYRENNYAEQIASYHEQYRDQEQVS